MNKENSKLFAFGISLMELRGKAAFEETFSIITFIKRIRKDTLIDSIY